MMSIFQFFRPRPVEAIELEPSIDDEHFALKAEYSRRRVAAIQKAGKARQDGNEQSYRYWMRQARELAVMAGYRASYGEAA